MVGELIYKISLLKEALKQRDNKSFSFFNKLLSEINEGFVNDAVDSILKSFTIIQYADFNFKEEALFEEIWEIAEKIKNQ